MNKALIASVIVAVSLVALAVAIQPFCPEPPNNPYPLGSGDWLGWWIRYLMD